MNEQAQTIAWLSRPSAYGEQGPVERIDTHISLVFLTGERAYKLKRAVKYDYVDFSTPALRQAACEAEVRLNRRTAPALYLGVVPVTRRPDGRLALAGEGTPVDWLVEMRRFDQELLFDRLAGRHALEPELMQGLAGAIAALHAAAERVADRGGRAGMAWVIDGNEAGFSAQGAGILDPAAAHRLTVRAREHLERVAGLLDVRREAGFVRWCHGDLHLRNIVLLEERPTLFDAVEFNPDIACIDVLYDLAFLLMDLWRRGLPVHASLVFNDYLGATLDIEGLAALPLFLSCRAAIRAKTGATASRLQPDAAEARRLQAAAREYLTMADTLLDRPEPRLIAIGGLSGSGKTTLARQLAPRIGGVPGALIVRSDVVRKALFGRAPLERLPDEAYEPGVSPRVYERIGALAAAALRAGQTVIADAVFAHPRERRNIGRVARDLGVPFTGIWLAAGEEVLVGRVAGRRGDASDATAAVVRQQLARDVGPIEWAIMNAALDAEVLARDAGELLRTA
jgi:uncharacterized protein